MFPHMYKVRPGKIQQAKNIFEPSSTESQPNRRRSYQEPKLEKPEERKTSLQSQPSSQKEPPQTPGSKPEKDSPSTTKSKQQHPFQRQNSSGPKRNPGLSKQKSQTSPGMATDCEWQMDGWSQRSPWSRQNSQVDSPTSNDVETPQPSHDISKAESDDIPWWQQTQDDDEEPTQNEDPPWWETQESEQNQQIHQNNEENEEINKNNEETEQIHQSNEQLNQNNEENEQIYQSSEENEQIHHTNEENEQIYQSNEENVEPVTDEAEEKPWWEIDDEEIISINENNRYWDAVEEQPVQGRDVQDEDIPWWERDDAEDTLDEEDDFFTRHIDELVADYDRQDNEQSNWRSRQKSLQRNSPPPQSTKDLLSSVQLRKVPQKEEKEKPIEPDSPETEKSGKEIFSVPLRKVSQTKPPSGEITPKNRDMFKVSLKKVPAALEKNETRRRPASWADEVQLKPVPAQNKRSDMLSEDIPDDEFYDRRLSLGDISSEEMVPPPPPPPPGVPGAPPPPPPPPGSLKVNAKTTKARKKLIDDIKKAARTRPDWMSVMKDVEGGVKLKRVKTQDKLDRSSPILPQSRGNEGNFVYASEKPNSQFSQMLNQIQSGIRLRHVRTNDRSRPDFNKLGLRKLRRQRTSDELRQIDPDAPEALPSSSDEEEDIDKMRDDLQSTKTQLTDEIKKTKQLERQNKILGIDIESLQAEVKKLKRQLKESGVQEVKAIKNCHADDMALKLSKSMSKLRMREEDLDFSELDVIDEEIDTLKGQIDAQQKRAEKAEQKVDELTQKLSLCGNASDEWETRSIYFEKKFKALQKEQGIELPDISCIGCQTEPMEVSPPSPTAVASRRSSSRKSFGSIFTRMESFQEEDEEESESSSSEEESEESEESDEKESDEDENGTDKKNAENEAKRKERELKSWKNKLNQSKEKEKNLKHDRSILQDKIHKLYVIMREERQEFIRVKKELKDMADMLKETEEESDEDASDDEETEEKSKKTVSFKTKNEEEEESEEEKEDELTDLESPEWESSESEEDSEVEDDIENAISTLQRLTQKHENKVAELRKENSSLKTQADRCNEMLAEEKRRHARLDNELQMLLTAIE